MQAKRQLPPEQIDPVDASIGRRLLIR